MKYNAITDLDLTNVNIDSLAIEDIDYLIDTELITADRLSAENRISREARVRSRRMKFKNDELDRIEDSQKQTFSEFLYIVKLLVLGNGAALVLIVSSSIPEISHISVASKANLGYSIISFTIGMLYSFGFLIMAINRSQVRLKRRIDALRLYRKQYDLKAESIRAEPDSEKSSNPGSRSRFRIFLRKRYGDIQRFQSEMSVINYKFFMARVLITMFVSVTGFCLGMFFSFQAFFPEIPLP